MSLQLIRPGTQLGTGAVVQVARAQSGSMLTGTALLPRDNTIPQSTEGDQFLSVSITPKSAANLLRIDIVMYLSSSATDRVSAALFKDSDTNALAAGNVETQTSSVVPVVFSHFVTAGTTSPITFKVRGGSASGTTTFNGEAGAGLFGGVMASSVSVTEVSE